MKTIARNLSQVHLRLLGLAAVLLIAAPPHAGAQQAIGGLRIERTGHTATLLPGGKILVVGGENRSGAVRDSEVFDPASRTFTSATGLLTARADHTATRLLDGRLFVVGGHASGRLLDSTEFYDPETGVFSAGPGLNHARAGHTATLLLDGRIAVVGGDADGSVEVLDPAVGVFRLIEARLAVARKFHAAALLQSGDLLIAGGVASGGAVLNSAELLETADLTFLPISLSMHVARSRPTLRVLPDGKVQAIGGDPDATMELFNPEGRYFSSLAHPAGNPALLSAALKTQSRAAVIGHRTPKKFLSLDGDVIASVTDELLDRTAYSLTEIPELNQALAAGGAKTSGQLKTTAALFTSSAATVTTDKTDYSPGETVIITGTGWQPGETVNLNIHRDTNEPPDTVLTAVADASGNIQNSEYVVLQSDLGVTFLLTATGQTSSLTAQTSFTDGALKIKSTTWPGSANPRTFGVTVQQFNGSTTCSGTPTSTSSGTADNNGFNTGGIGSGDSWLITANPNADAPNPSFVFSQWTTPTNPAPVFATGYSASDRTTCIVGFPNNNRDLVGNYVPGFSITFDATANPNLEDVVGTTQVLSVAIGTDPAVFVTKADLPKTFSNVATGTNIQYSYLSPLTSTTINKQFRWLSTAGTGSASGQTGQSSGGTGFALTATSTVTATYKAQWKQTFTHSGLTADATGTVVTVNASPQTFAALPFSTFVDDGATVTYAYTDLVTSSVTGKRYALTTPASSPATGYTVSGANTVTGTYKIQYQLTFAQSGIGGDSTGTVVTVAAAAKTAADLPFSDWFDTGSSVSYVFSDPVASTVSGKRYALTTPAPSPASPITVSAAATVTGTYKIQYQVTFTQSGIGVDSTGTVVTVAASAKTAADLPFSDWFDSGSSVTYSYTDPVASSVSGKRYKLTTPSPTPASPITVLAAATVTGTYKIQYQVTFTQSGLGGDSTGTVVTVAASAKTAGDLPFSDWFDSGSSLNYTYSDPVASTASGKRYALTTPAPSPASGFSVSGAITITGTYKIQWQLTFTQSGIGVDSTGTVVTVAASAKTAGDLPFSDWFDSGSSLSYTYFDPVASTVTNKRYALTTPTPTPASPITVSASITVTGTYKTQFKLVFTQSGIGGDSTVTVVTVASVPKAAGDLPFTTDWLDSGSSLTYTYSDPVASTVSGKRYALTTPAASPASPISVSAPITVTGTYKVQFQVTFAQSGIGGDSAGTIVTVGVTAHASLPFSDWFDSGSAVTYSYSDPVASSVSGKRYALTTPAPSPASGFSVSGATTITGTYKIQWQLTLAITSGVPGGLANITGGASGSFYDSGTVLSLTAATPVADGTDKRWRFDNWSGDASGSTNPASVTMSAPRSVTANYIAQYQLTLAITAGVPGGLSNITGGASGTFYDSGTVLGLTAATPFVETPSVKRWRFDNWSGGATGSANPVSVTMDQARSITANYIAQYQLTFAQSGIGGDSTGTIVTVGVTAHASLPFSDWFDSGSAVTYSYSDPVASSVSGKRYALTTPAPSPASGFSVSGATTITGTYKIQWQLTFTQSGIGVDSTGTVVTVAASAKTAGDLPFSDWFDSGSSLSYTYFDPVASTVTNKRYALTTPTPTPASPITVSASITVTGTYKTQFKLVFTQSGIGGDSTVTVVTVASVPKAAGDLPFTTDWLDSGSSLTYAYSDPVASTVSEKRYALTTPAASPASPISVSAPITVTGTYKIQFQITFTQSGINGDSTGTVVTVAGSPKTAAVLPFSDWFDSGSSLTYSYSDPVASSVSGKRYALTTPAPSPASGFSVSGATTVTGTYKIQYQLTLAITFGVPGGLSNISGGANGNWYDSGTPLALTATTPVADVSKQWGFDNWSGDVSSPPNSANPVSITMNQARAVTGNYAYPTATFASNGAVGEGSPATISFTGQSHPFGGTPFHYAYACDNSSLASSTYAVNSTTQAFMTCTFNNNGTYTIRGRIIDKNDGYTEYTTSQIVNNVAPTILSVTANPSVPISLGGVVTVMATFTDPGTADTHTCDFAWDDTTTTTGVPGSTGSGSCSAPHTYAATGVYTVTVTVTDGDGGSATGTYQFVVIYDPNAGFVTGGGWINQPSDGFPALPGKANFGFVSKYKKGSNVPEGETEFQFKAGDINFHSSVQDAGSLVISGGRKATYRGDGTVNGVSGYRFVLIAYDGNQPGGDGIDRFRIKITQGSSLIYDNRPLASEDLDLADPTALGGGSIVIHK